MLKIAHFSDPHLSAPLESARALFDKRLLGFLNGRFTRRSAYPVSRVERAVPKILAEKPDVIVFSGDATTCSQPAEFDLAWELLKPLAESGVPILYSPGNHDCYVRDPLCLAALNRFTERLTGSAASWPRRFDTPECVFLSFHSARPTNPLMSCGFFDRESLAFLREVCREKTKPVVAVSHFPVLEQGRGVSGFRRRLFGSAGARTLLAEGGLDLVLCGHIHKPYLRVDESGRGEACAGSITKTGLFRIVTLEEGVFTFRTVPEETSGA